MDEALIQNWNLTLSPEDDIYILGDFARPGDKFEEPINEYYPRGWAVFDSGQERSAYLAIARRNIAEFYRTLETPRSYEGGTVRQHYSNGV